MDLEDDEFLYRLVGVTIHRGTANHGHYFSLISTCRGENEPTEPEKWMDPTTDYWRTFNDDEVTFCGSSEIKKTGFGGDGLTEKDTEAFIAASAGDASYGTNAYMLVYECKKKNELRQMKSTKEDNTEM